MSTDLAYTKSQYKTKRLGCRLTSSVREAEMNGALAEALSQFGGLPAVTGIDIGARKQDGKDEPSLALRIHVARPTDTLWLHRNHPVPKTIDGLPTQVSHYQYRNHSSEAGDGSCMNHFRVSSDGLGQALYEYLNGQHPIVGQHHREAGNDGTQALVVCPYSEAGSARIGQLLQDVEDKLRRFPGAPASVLMYSPGRFAPPNQFIDLYIKSRCQTNINNPVIVDGFGYYRLSDDNGKGLQLGFKLIPSHTK